MKILVIDNYDSFTYNLVQYIQEILAEEVDVFRNDAITLDQVAAYDVIVLSPGPGVPNEAGIMPAVIQRFYKEKFILGVCLGHQAIGEAFGAEIENLAHVFHGIESAMDITNRPSILFKDLPSPFQAGRYHSWVIKKGTLADELKVTATDDTGKIMAIEHKDYDVFGLQFHPESIMTPSGKAILSNFFEYVATKTPIAL